MMAKTPMQLAIVRAAMDAEPVYQCEFCHHDANGELQWHWEDVNQAFYEQYDSERRGHRRVLYAAPPVPVLQEDIPESVYEILCQACGGKAWMYEAALWDACRDEILKSSASVKPSNDAGCGTKNPSNCASVKDHQITASMAKGIALKLGAELNDEEADVFADGYNAALQSFGNSEQLELVSQPYKLPPNSFTDDELEMMSHGDNPQANAYRELLAFRRNSPVIPDGWIPVNDRLPESKPGSYEYIVFETLNNRAHHDYWNVPDRGDDAFTPFWNHYGKYVTHWMPLPAAPQQLPMERQNG